MPSNKPFNPHAHPSARTVILDLKGKDATFWKRKGEQRALAIFKAAAARVPAYKDFLKKNKVNPERVTSYAHFQEVPPTDKKNYIKEYPLKDLAWDGKLDHPSVFTSTSGSTGEQTYFFRSSLVDWQCSILQEIFIENSLTPRKPTLVVVCFGMGIWIGGIITYEAITRLGERGFPTSIITPGINKTEIFKALKKLAPSYHQTIIFGYPPFLKDLIDEAADWGINFSKMNVRFSTAAESYSEDYRDFLGKAVKLKDPVLDIMSIYGSADIGAMGFESPTSISIRRLARKDKKFSAKLFVSTQKTPTLAQFVPTFINFEEVEGELYLTGSNSIPLVRYAIGDHGGVYSHKEMTSLLREFKYNIPRVRNDKFKNMELPFVYVFERNDFSTTLYGAQIYPEAIREVLIKNPFVKLLSGKFTLLTKYTEKHDQYLEINLELAREQRISKIARAQLLDHIIKNLMLKNSEFRELHRFIGKRALPKLMFWDHEDPNFFKPGIKQQWVKK